MKKKIAKHFLFSILFLSTHTFSQSISKGEFKRRFDQGNLIMLDKFYDTAVKVFLSLHQTDPSNANVNYKIGRCYLNIPSQKLKAIPYLENAIKQTNGSYQEDDANEKNSPEDAIYYLGQAYHYGYRFDEAIGQFKKFRELMGKMNLDFLKEIDHWSETSKSAKEIVSKPVECTITNLGDSVNSEYADYSPVISADESILAFTSRREGTGGKENKNVHDEYFEDVWICKQGNFGTWTKAKGISREINTDENEATTGLSADGQVLYIYRDDKGDGNIYVCKLEGDYWGTPVKMDPKSVNSNKWEPSACVSADGTTLYFVSNRAGGFGGRDIYQSHISPNGTLSTPENLGATINTEYDEDGPFIHPDGVTLFFSSTGHNSIGGFDIFYTNKIANNLWSKPTNVGYPINTTDDDIYFTTSSDGRRAFYSSMRPEGKGGKDIYMVSMPKPFVKPVAILVGYIKNRDNSPIPKNTSVTTKGKNGQIISCTPNELSGKFIQSLLPGQEYEITITSNGNTLLNDHLLVSDNDSYLNLGHGFFQRTIYIGDSTHVFSQNRSKESEKNIQTNPLEGKILFSKDVNDVAANVAIQLLNNQGNVIASTITDKDGQFNFQNIPTDQNYMIKMDENDPIVKKHNQFFITNKGETTFKSASKEGGLFVFENLPSDLNKLGSLDAKDASALLSKMKGNISTGKSAQSEKTGINNLSINLLDSKGQIIQTQTTDQRGDFIFTNLASDENYSISFNEKDPALSTNKKIFLMNDKNTVIKEVSRKADFFVFENLPSELNSLSTLNSTDDSKLVSMKGKILKSSNANDVLANLNIFLVDSKGNVIQKTKTDENGQFNFENLKTDENYTIKLDEKDPQFLSCKKIYLTSSAGKIVQEINTKNGSTFKKMPADLNQLTELKNILISVKKDSVSIMKKPNMYKGDDQFDFVVYFPYNKKEINISVGSFLSLMNKVEKNITETGNATIVIASSSSNVPTLTFESNEALSSLRANTIKDKIHSSLSLKNIDETKITYQIESKVNGPEYKNDARQNKKEYERWQFVKVIVK